MKNRYIPFGYQIQNGDSVINTEQAATVQHIFYAYTEGQSFKEIAEYLTTSGTAYHFSDNSWNKNIVARILANEIYCGAKGYPAIISKEVYSQAASIRSNKTVTYSAVLKPFRSDMQCACCGERLYWRPRTQQWTCRQCGMWSKPMQPENMAQQIVDRLYQIQQHPEIPLSATSSAWRCSATSAKSARSCVSAWWSPSVCWHFSSVLSCAKIKPCKVIKVSEAVQRPRPFGISGKVYHYETNPTSHRLDVPPFGRYRTRQSGDPAP